MLPDEVLMPLIYRVMLVDAETGSPQVGTKFGQLGVRHEGDKRDIVCDEKGDVQPETGGMSVNPSLDDIPATILPKRLKERFPERFPWARGNNRFHCFRMGDGPFLAGPINTALRLRPDRADPVDHGLVEPSRAVPLAKYVKDLADTRDDWLTAENVEG